MSVGGTHDGSLDQTVVAIEAHQCFHDESDEAQVVFGSLAGGIEQHAIVGREAPVVVLARTVDAGKGLLVEQHAESVFAGHLLHQRHEQHVVVNGQVDFLVDRSNLKLVGSHLVVAGLAGD